MWWCQGGVQLYPTKQYIPRHAGLLMIWPVALVLCHGARVTYNAMVSGWCMTVPIRQYIHSHAGLLITWRNGQLSSSSSDLVPQNTSRVILISVLKTSGHLHKRCGFLQMINQVSIWVSISFLNFSYWLFSVRWEPLLPIVGELLSHGTCCVTLLELLACEKYTHAPRHIVSRISYSAKLNKLKWVQLSRVT